MTRHHWVRLRDSFWFLPALILAGGIALATLLIWFDSSGPRPWMARWPRVFGAGAEGARGMLSTIAGSMMTVVGVTFSMTLVTLALASSQYSSRVLRNFIRDRVTQSVLGAYAAIFVYCIIVLRTIRSADEGGFVPGMAVLVAVIGAVGGAGLLIYFIHHVAASIQASNIVGSVAEETTAAIDRLFPKRLGDDREGFDEDQPLPPFPTREWQPILADATGYIQSVDNEALLRLAWGCDTIVRMDRGIGDFVVRDTPIASLAFVVAPDAKAVSALRQSYVISRNRSIDQDAGFGLRQIVDMALRALSPGINDTTTAVMCVDHLTAILAHMASRPMPSPRRYARGELRVIAIAPTFASAVDDAFDQIRESADGNVAIILRMLGGLQTIAGVTENMNRRRVLADHVRRLVELAARTIEAPHDKARVEARVAEVREAIGLP